MLQDQAEKFGFNERMHRRAPGRAVASVPDRPDEPQTAQSAIGQFDTAATPLQMAMVAAGIANDGKLMKPYMVDELRSADLDVIDETNPEELQPAGLRATTPAADQQMMVDVVENGTGGNAQIPGVTVGGKTGTAQHGVTQDARTPGSSPTRGRRLPGRGRRRRSRTARRAATTSPAAASPRRSPRRDGGGPRAR